MRTDRAGAEWKTRDELAHDFGCSVRTISYLVNAGLPSRKNRRGVLEFPWPQANVWHTAYKGRSTTKDAVALRTANAKAELAEWELLEKRRQVVTMAYLEREIAGLNAAFRSAALSLPGRIAGEAAHQSAAEIQLIVERAVADLFGTVRTAALALGSGST